MKFTFKLLDLMVIFVMTLSAPVGVLAAPPAQDPTPPPAPTIVSDLPDYGPGSLVTLTGTNWQGDLTVHIFVDDAINKTWQHVADVPVDGDGNIKDIFVLPSYFVSDYTVVATGIETQRVATATFTDADASPENLWQCDPPSVYDPSTYTCVSSGPNGWVTGNDDGPFAEGETVPSWVWL